MILDQDLQLANRLADAAATAIAPYFRNLTQGEIKADASPVTLADRQAEAAMRQILEAERAEDGIIGEEYGTHNEGAARQWVLDPIDGTVSFMAGRPIFGTLIALMQDGWPVLGIINQPIASERWVGQIGGPTTLNGQVAYTRGAKTFTQCTLATSSPHYFDEGDAQTYMKIAAAIGGNRPQAAIIYGGDCYNYALLASGHVDIVMESGLKLHDYAALVPVVEGAGGVMSDWQGNPLNAQSAEAEGGRVLALGDPARLEDVLEAMG